LFTRIESTFARLKAEGRMAFMPFVTCGDPDITTTLAVIRELASRGVDLIEVGFPYSDPIADGPVIQASYTRALAKHLHVKDIFSGIAELRADDKVPPLVAMVSYAIIFRMGPEKFVSEAHDAGFAGLIVPDLPGDEAAEFAALVKSYGLDLVQLIAPTTPVERVDRILQSSSGFLYCISVAGTTGVRNALPGELQKQLRELRSKTSLPLAVGFGISRPDQVDSLRGLADGIIVGSAIVRQFEPLANGGGNTAAVVAKVGAFAAEMMSSVAASRQ
jgi:tryptophan synthase alpha chain